MKFPEGVKCMKKYYFNPQYVINETEKVTAIFTDNMEYIYILNDVEKIIVSKFIEPRSMDEAVKAISDCFCGETFKKDECEEFINKLIEQRIIICC